MFPEVSAAVIDNLLGTEWRSAGAYEAYRAKTSSGQYQTDNNNGGSKPLY